MKSKLVIKIYDETGKKQEHKEFTVPKDDAEKFFNLVQALCTKGVKRDEQYSTNYG